MEEINEKVEIEDEEIWEKELKQTFLSKIHKSFMGTLNSLKKEDNKNIKDLEQQYDEKYTKKTKDQISELEQINNNSHNNKKKMIKKNNNNNNIFENNNHNIENNNNTVQNKDNIKLFNKNVDLDNMDENDENLRKKEINLKEIHNPLLIHLSNIDNTNPLINLILQCLSNIKTLLYYYFNPFKEEKILQKSKQNPNNDYLGPSFLKLLDHLWKSKKKEYYPEEIHKILKKLMLNDYKSNDPGKIISFILTKLHEELKINENINNQNEDDPFSHFNEYLAYNNYFKIIDKQKTKITTSFYSTLKIKKLCIACNYPSYFFEAIPIINLFLDVDNHVTQLLHFEDFKYRSIKKENEQIKELCYACADGEEKKKNISKDIYYLSEIIIININREKDPNHKITFKYPECFDPKKIFNKDIDFKVYNLMTVIKKDGNNNPYKYIAYCKNFIDNNWYSYNNEQIELIKDYKNYIFDGKYACMLIYAGEN